MGRDAREGGPAARWVRATGLAGAAAAVAAVAVAVWPGRNANGEAAGPRPGGSPVFAPADARRTDAMDAEIGVVRERIRLKEAVAAALVRGNLTADRAVARFRQLLAEDPKVRAGLRCRHPGAAEADLAVHLLIHFVEREERAAAGGAGRVLAELRSAVGRPGPELVAAAGGAR